MWIEGKPNKPGYYFVKDGNLTGSAIDIIEVFKKSHGYVELLFYYIPGWEDKYSVDTHWQYTHYQPVNMPES